MLAFSWGDTVAIPLTWQSLIALLVPIVVALIAKYRGGDSKVHAIIAIVLSAALATWAMLTDDIPNDTVLAVVSAFLGVFLPQLAAYVGLYKPVANINARVAPNKGIG